MFKFIKGLNPVVRRYVVLLAEVVVIVGVTLFSLCPFSCRVSAEGIKVIGGDYIPPVLEKFTVVDQNTLCLEFSEKVSITGSIVSQVGDLSAASSDVHSDTEKLSPALEAASGIGSPKVVDSRLEYSEDGKTVTVRLLESTEIGEHYELYGVVKDFIGNSLTFAMMFSGFNSRVPKIVMTEIQTVSVGSQNTKEKSNDTFRNEFVEFLALSDGNLCGLELLSGYDGESKKFVFPKVEVKAGEVFVVHMRNRGNGCISETGDNLAEAFSSYTSETVRDLWTESTATAIGNKTDVLIVRNQADNVVYDAVMFHESSVANWTKSMPEYALMAVDSGIYDSADMSEAVIITEMSDTKTLSRVNAKELQEAVLNGVEIQYPVKESKDSWVVTTESAGRL